MSTPIRSPGQGAGIANAGAERRLHARAATTVPASLRPKDRLQLLQGIVGDLSVGGAAFVGPQALPAGCQCTLQFDLPSGGSGAAIAFALPCTVVAALPVAGPSRSIRLNLRFVGLPAVARGQLEAFVRSFLASRR